MHHHETHRGKPTGNVYAGWQCCVCNQCYAGEHIPGRCKACNYAEWKMICVYGPWKKPEVQS